MFVPGKSFQSNLMFVGEAETYLSGAPLWGRLLAFPTNNRANTLVIKLNSKITNKKYYSIGPRLAKYLGTYSQKMLLFSCISSTTITAQMKEFGFLIYVMGVSNQLIADAGCLNNPLNWRRDIHQNDTLHNDTQDRGLICDNQHK